MAPITNGYPFLRFEPYTPSQVWLGTSSSVWATAGNWSEEAEPAGTQNIIVPNVTNTPVISGATTKTVNNLLVETGGQMDLANDGWLTLSGNLTNNGTFTIITNATVHGPLIVIVNSDGTGIFTSP